MKPKDLSALSRVCRQHGISKLRIQGAEVEVTFDPGFVPPVRMSKKQKAVEAELKQILEASDEEIALYSSPSFEEDPQ